jgi:hypothetical protein
MTDSCEVKQFFSQAAALFPEYRGKSRRLLKNKGRLDLRKSRFELIGARGQPFSARLDRIAARPAVTEHVSD